MYKSEVISFRAVRAEKHASTDGSFWCGCRAALQKKMSAAATGHPFRYCF
jgi:hypothetical protein